MRMLFCLMFFYWCVKSSLVFVFVFVFNSFFLFPALGEVQYFVFQFTDSFFCLILSAVEPF